MKWRISVDDEQASLVSAHEVEADNLANALFRLGLSFGLTGDSQGLQVVRVEEPAGWKEVRLP
jgi:hypothetical protein